MTSSVMTFGNQLSTQSVDTWYVRSTVILDKPSGVVDTVIFDSFTHDLLSSLIMRIVLFELFDKVAVIVNYNCSHWTSCDHRNVVVGMSGQRVGDDISASRLVLHVVVKIG